MGVDVREQVHEAAPLGMVRAMTYEEKFLEFFRPALNEIIRSLRINEGKHPGFRDDDDITIYGCKIDRHKNRFFNGEEYDKKDGQHHIAAVGIRTLQVLNQLMKRKAAQVA